MGEATSNAVRVAESLVRQGLAVIKDIKSFTWTPPEEDSKKDQFQKIRKVKLVIKLEKSANFDKMTEGLFKNK